MSEKELPQRPTIGSEVAKLIQAYIAVNPQSGGIRGLAERAEISYDSMQKYARGANLPPLEKWNRIANALQVSPAVRPIIDPLFHNLQGEAKERKLMNQTHHEKDEENSPLPGGNASPSHAPEDSTHPEDRQEVFLPVHGFVWFYPEEIEIIDHPAFQRLSGMHQLGVAYLVFRGATHRRLEHALGTVAIAQRMLDAVQHNCRKRGKTKIDPKDRWLLGAPPTLSEVRFIRLAALLHDIGHLPFGHTFEDELHLIGKHDKEPRLDKVFRKEVWHGDESVVIETLGARIDRLYKKYLPAPLVMERPSEILKRIIIHKQQENGEKNVEQAAANAGLRLAICADVVGNTICADLLDYLHRDWYHVGKPRHFDERLFHYMEIRTPKANNSLSAAIQPQPSAEDVFVISIGNRPKLRTDGISGILDLLESRYQLAEAVLFHRTKMSATSMLERALSLSVRVVSTGKNVEAPNSNNAALEDWLLDNAEETLLPALITGRGLLEESKLKPNQRESWLQARKLASRLLRRDLYDVLLMVTYDEFEQRDVDNIQQVYADGPDAASQRAAALRLIETDFGLHHGAVTMYCPESRMNSKIAEVRLFLGSGTVWKTNPPIAVSEDSAFCPKTGN